MSWNSNDGAIAPYLERLTLQTHSRREVERANSHTQACAGGHGKFWGLLKPAVEFSRKATTTNRKGTVKKQEQTRSD